MVNKSNAKQIALLIRMQNPPFYFCATLPGQVPPKITKDRKNQ